MKKIFLTIVIFSVSALTIAQTSFNWTLNDSIVTDIDANSYTELKIEQTNVSGGDLNLAIEVVYNDIPATWDGMICVEGICLGTIPAVGGTAEMSTVADGENGYVRLTANPMGGLEQIVLRVKVYDVDNPVDADTATWVINSVDYTGVNDHDKASDLTIYPNPCDSYFSIDSDLEIDYIELIGLDGRIIYSQQYTSNSNIDIAHLPAAIYVVKMYKEGKLISYEKLIKHV